MSLPTYDEIASAIGIRRCRGIEPSGLRCYAGDHDRGVATLDTVHWRDRNASRQGIKRFLMLAAEATPTLDGLKQWQKLWTQLRLVWRWVDQIGGFRIPRSDFEMERKRLRALLLKVPTTAPGRKEAYAWASRRSDGNA